MKRWSSCLFLMSALSLHTLADVQPINKDWKFILGDVPEARYYNYDDATWRQLNLPHDWAFENGFKANGEQRDNGGYASGGVGWYRKDLYLSADDVKSDKVFLDFEAAYMNSEVWINGQYLGKCPYGYIPFSYDVTSHLREGKNVISVRIDNSREPSARWYHGCGIYANVHLRMLDKAYFEKDGTFIHMANTKGEVSFQSFVKATEKNQKLYLVAEIVDAKGKVKADYKSSLLTVGQQGDTLSVKMKVRKPSLWSPESPNLYTMRLKLQDETGNAVDTQQIRMGFRDIAWDADQGFLLNGAQCKLYGVCDHLEAGPVGAAYTPQLLRWKLQLLKDMGCNAIRTAHNPQVPAFYDLCDEMGIMVMDEAFDGWKRKAEFDYGMQAFAEHWERDLRAFVRRDRNHPSIIIYSVGNETNGPLGADLVRVCHEEDYTRLVTSGSGNPQQMDVVGINGASETPRFINNYKSNGKAFVGTENPHTWQVRGYYRSLTWYRDGYNVKNGNMMVIPNLTDKEIFTYDWITPEQRRNRKQIFNSSYDNATVRATARHIIETSRNHDWFSGNFRWTGFDYLGEAGYVHGGWPFRSFESGALDLAGFPKDLFYLYQSEWTNKDMVHILPHWSHPKMQVGTLIPVWVYTTGDEVELKLNGKSLGRKSKGSAWNKMQCEFMVPWQEGTVEAIAYRKGKEIARTKQTTADAPSQLNVSVENKELKADGEDVSILTIRQEDAKGTLYPYGENRIHVHVNGPAFVFSFENGSPVDTECNYKASSRRCFFGLNRLFVQSIEDKSDASVSVVMASISGDKKLMQSDKVTITCDEVALRGEVSNKKYDIFYTTDGTTPTRQSKRYQGAFAVTPGTTVKAVVYDGDKLLMSMSESFGPNEGLYWGNPNVNDASLMGEQAEQMQLINCQVARTSKGAHGGAYVIPAAGKGTLAWYQENDGGVAKSNLTIRYMQNNAGKSTVMELFNNKKLVNKINFVDTGNKWKTVTVPLTIQSGANQLLLKSVSKEGAPHIDEVHIQ